MRGPATGEVPVNKQTERQRLDTLIDHYKRLGSSAHQISLRMNAGDMWAMLEMTPPDGQPPKELTYRGMKIVALGKPDPGPPGRV